MKFRFATLALGFVLAAALAFSPGAAQAVTGKSAHCGDVLTTDAYLAEDLDCGNGPGLTLKANVTLDMRGHRLAGRSDSQAPGIAVVREPLGDPGGVTIRNGVVTGWPSGVRVQGDDFGPAMDISTVYISGVTFISNGIGLFLARSDSEPNGARGFAVARSKFIDNVVAVYARVEGDVDIKFSIFKRNKLEAVLALFPTKFRMQDSSVLDAVYGVDCGATRSCEVSNSVFKRVQAPISVGDNEDETRFVGNTIVGRKGWENGICSGTDGCSALNGVGIYNSHNVLVKDNRIRHYTVALRQQNSEGSIENNTFMKNGTGLELSAFDLDFAIEITLISNSFLKNGDGLVSTAEGQALLKDNRAFHNTGWGIYAPSARDLGGNRAAGNGKSPQCVGVVCATAS